jgi:hypothetical protein
MVSAMNNIQRRMIIIHTIQHWDSLLSNREDIAKYYTAIPRLESAVVRSVHLNRLGPAVTLRMDAPEFPDHPLGEWVAAGCDELELQLQFADTRDMIMHSEEFPVVANLSFASAGERRVAVNVRAEGAEIEFTCSDRVRIGRINAYKSSDPSVRYHASLLGRKLWNMLPDPFTRVYYESL